MLLMHCLCMPHQVTVGASLADVHTMVFLFQEVARLALAKNTGARGLRTILEDLLMAAMFEVPDSLDVNAVYMGEGDDGRIM
jgi:ATP-dependent protease Clp ATPase subunit